MTVISSDDFNRFSHRQIFSGLGVGRLLCQQCWQRTMLAAAIYTSRKLSTRFAVRAVWRSVITMRNDLQDMRHSIGSTLLSAQRSSKNGRREEGKKEFMTREKKIWQEMTVKHSPSRICCCCDCSSVLLTFSRGSPWPHGSLVLPKSSDCGFNNALLLTHTHLFWSKSLWTSKVRFCSLMCKLCARCFFPKLWEYFPSIVDLQNRHVQKDINNTDVRIVHVFVVVFVCFGFFFGCYCCYFLTRIPAGRPQTCF